MGAIWAPDRAPIWLVCIYIYIERERYIYI